MPNGPGNLSWSMPPRDSDFARKQKDLERAQREANAANTLQAAQFGKGGIIVDGGGSITVQGGGSLNVLGSGSINVPSGGLNSAGSISAATTITAGGSITSTGGNLSAAGSVSGASLSVSGTATAGGFSTGGAVSAGGGVSGASGTFSSSLNSVGAYNTDVSTLPGARQTVWQHNSGVYGFAPSTREAKVNLSDLPFTASDARAVRGYLFQYRGQLAIRNDPENPNYDPEYTVPWDVGLMAEDLIAHNMACFVVFEEDGVTAKTINYDLFGAIVPLVLDADLDARLRAAGL